MPVRLTELAVEKLAPKEAGKRLGRIDIQDFQRGRLLIHGHPCGDAERAVGTKRYELNEAQWQRIASLLPGKAADPGRTGADNRLFVNGCLWVLRSGAHWCDLPERYGRWKTVHRRFSRWCSGRWRWRMR